MVLFEWDWSRLINKCPLMRSLNLFASEMKTDSDSSDANRFRILIKESLLIKRDQPQLNKTIKLFPLKLFD